ncbi:MAG: dTDP-4-dehydrorhamnose reductase [Bacteroidales bacterium]|nr:dTDP-4-dehydrorhamnose reductase [Bacteroidales bacterium]
MNILVTGSNGQLGNEMQIVARNSADRYIFTDVAELDITNVEAVNAMVKSEQIGAIINCAAYTNVDKAEDDEALCQKLNADAVNNLAVAMKEVEGLLVHVSTDYVFGGDPYNTPCTEEQKGTPTGVYGRTKLMGEQNILASGCKHIIIRTAWLYSEFGKNFVKTMLNLTATKPQLNVVFDQVGTPTYALDLAMTIFDIVENRKYEGKSGIYHYSNEGVCSWFDFTKMIAEIAGNTQCDIQPCHSNEFPSKVIRPSYSVLDKTKIKHTFGAKVPYWTDSLRMCMKNLLTENK